MDEEILKSEGVLIRHKRTGLIDNYMLRIGNWATLIRKEDKRAYGMVYAMTQKEIYSLSEGAGLSDYVIGSLLCTLDNGSKIAVLCKKISSFWW